LRRQLNTLLTLGGNPRAQRVVCDLTAACLVIVALIAATRTTSGLSWPFDNDHWRDISQAQTVRDGHPFADPYYKDEWTWYNPLLSWALAVGSIAFGQNVWRFHVQSGPYLNLVGPVALYFLIRRVAGSGAALAGLTLYLFFPRNPEPFPLYATYSPWLFPANFAQGLFFVSLLALTWALDRRVPFRLVTAGALVGVTFLAHTAPAVILLIVMCALLGRDWRSLVIASASAFVVAAPFLLSIGIHYKFHVINRAPVIWTYDPVSPRGISRTLRGASLLIAGGLAGLIVAPRRALLFWIAASATLLIYSLSPLPRFVPAFHFWLYTTAGLVICTGCLIDRLCRWPLAIAALCIAVTIWEWPTYIGQIEFQSGRRQALARDPDFAAASTHLHRALMPDDVVLGTYGASTLIIGPAGRKTVAAIAMLSNPYIDVDSRARDRDRMLDAIRKGDLAMLTALASRYGVSAVLSVGPEECAAASAILPLAWRSGNVCLSTLPA